MKHVIRWKISKHRQDQRSGPIKRIPQSDWLKYLWKKETERVK